MEGERRDEKRMGFLQSHGLRRYRLVKVIMLVGRNTYSLRKLNGLRVCESGACRDEILTPCCEQDELIRAFDDGRIDAINGGATGVIITIYQLATSFMLRVLRILQDEYTYTVPKLEVLRPGRKLVKETALVCRKKAIQVVDAGIIPVEICNLIFNSTGRSIDLDFHVSERQRWTWPEKSVFKDFLHNVRGQVIELALVMAAYRGSAWLLVPSASRPRG